MGDGYAYGYGGFGFSGRTEDNAGLTPLQQGIGRTRTRILLTVVVDIDSPQCS